MLALLLLLFAAAQTPDGVIEGSVTDSISGAPVAVAQVFIAGCGWKRLVKADDRGSFRFENLAPCGYAVSAQRVGYVGEDYGAKPAHVSLGGAGASEKVTLKLVPTATITGRVFDEDNHPLAGVNVYAKGRFFVHEITDESGRYIMPYIAPGECALEARLPAELRRKGLKRDYGYPAVVPYPGPITAFAGASAGDFDIVVRRVRLVDVRGRLVEPDGRPLARAQFELDAGNGGPDEGRHRIDGAGGFRLDLLEPGPYTFRIFRSGVSGELPWSVPVNVPRNGLTALTIAVPPYGGVEGTVTLPKNAREAPTELSVTLRGSPRADSVQAPVGADGKFRFGDVPPGQWDVRIGGNVGVPDLAREFGVQAKRFLYQAGIRCGGRPCQQGVVTVGEGAVAPVEILLSDEVGEIGGKVVNDKQDVVRDAVVLVRGGGRVYIISSAQDGSFSIALLPAGDYRVVALPPGTDPHAVKPDACREHEAGVEVKPGAPAFARLEICIP